MVKTGLPVSSHNSIVLKIKTNRKNKKIKLNNKFAQQITGMVVCFFVFDFHRLTRQNSARFL